MALYYMKRHCRLLSCICHITGRRKGKVLEVPSEYNYYCGPTIDPQVTTMEAMRDDDDELVDQIIIDGVQIEESNEDVNFDTDVDQLQLAKVDTGDDYAHPIQLCNLKDSG